MSESSLLTLTAASIALVHTLIGPDHYVPFVAMARARGWPMSKTLRVTLACGIGHVAGSVVVGSVGLGIGLVVVQLERFEAARGDSAAWLLIAFGSAYLVWGVVRAYRDVPHIHVHMHADGTVHSHEHRHDASHVHVHDSESPRGSRGSLIPWALFIAFVLGPCEPLIPLLIVPAARLSILATVTIVTVYAMTTLATMVACVVMLSAITQSVPRTSDALQRFTHAFAGAAVLLCGVLIKCGF